MTWEASPTRRKWCSIRTSMFSYKCPSSVNSWFREQIRQRAVELVSWIIDSGNERTLGITKGDILNGNVGKKVRCLSATSRAELWTKRYQQQHFQAWRTPAGKVSNTHTQFKAVLTLIFSRTGKWETLKWKRRNYWDKASILKTSSWNLAKDGIKRRTYKLYVVFRLEIYFVSILSEILVWCMQQYPLIRALLHAEIETAKQRPCTRSAANDNDNDRPGI